MPTMLQTTLKTPSTKRISTIILSDTPGRLRLRVAPAYRQTGDMQSITSALETHPNINQVRTNIQNGTITIQHDGNHNSLKNVMVTLKDLGIIFTDITEGNTEAAAQVSTAVVDLNSRVREASKGVIDLRFLFPLGLATLSARQLLTRGLQIETIPWYVLAWYAFDSFIKLHGTSKAKSTGE